ncbi:hypothetical protein Tco_0962657, partial [Tanacetum coccineum]
MKSVLRYRHVAELISHILQIITTIVPVTPSSSWSNISGFEFDVVEIDIFTQFDFSESNWFNFDLNYFFLCYCNDENAIVTIFGGSKSGGEIVGFGTEQVILVRDDRARTRIIEYFGRQALVLTMLECKGLEFQDILLYNFFGTSPLKDQWRVIYGYMK